MGQTTANQPADSAAEPPILLVYGSDQNRDLILSGLPPSERHATLPWDTPDGVEAALLSKCPSLLIWEMRTLDQARHEALTQIIAESPLPILVFCQEPSPGEAQQALQAGVSAFVVDGLEPSRVPFLIEITRERFRLTDALHQELSRSKEELAARKTIERAKGLLMERRNMSEREAYDAMRRMAMAQGKTIRAIAETVLSISDILP